MTDHRISRGRDTERLVAEFLARQLCVPAKRNPASLPGSDVQGIPGLDVEVKARADLDITGWLRQQRKRITTEIPLLVYRPNGYGPERVSEFPAIMTLGAWTDLALSGLPEGAP